MSASVSIYEDDEWQLAEGEINGIRQIIRMRTAFPSTADRELFCKLILVSWNYDPESSGMPARAVHADMQMFEDALEGGTEFKGVAVQVLSLTGGGLKQWRYYAADVDEFMESLNADLRGHAAYPLEMESFEDPDWNGLSEFLSIERNGT